MRKLIIFLLSIVLLAYAITYFASLDSRIAGEAFGYKFDGAAGIIVGGFFFLLLAAIYLTHKIKDIMALPGKIRARDAEAHRTRGMAALTRGLEAVAVGDASAASHHAKIAHRHLKDMSLTRLLSAQAAQLSGDETGAKESFSAMLEAPETEFMGLKGLYLQAMAKGDHASAKEYAERAFRLRPNARWAFDSVVDLGLERGAWGETRAAIEKARRNNIISAEKADRGAAALLTADAYAAAASEDTDTALKESEAALKLAKGFSPAAVLAAKLLASANKTGKAAKIIETAFEVDAHPALIRSYDKLYTDEPVEKRASLLRKLADKSPSSREAALLRARAHNLQQDWTDAIAALEPLLTGAPMAAEYALMATAAEFGYEAVGIDVRSASQELLCELGYDARCCDLRAFDDADGFDVISMADVLEQFEVGLYMDNGMTHTTSTYEGVMAVLEERQISYRPAARGADPQPRQGGHPRGAASRHPAVGRHPLRSEQQLGGREAHP